MDELTLIFLAVMLVFLAHLAMVVVLLSINKEHKNITIILQEINARLYQHQLIDRRKIWSLNDHADDTVI